MPGKSSSGGSCDAFLYTLGWLVEIPARSMKPDLGPLLLKLGMGLGFFLITIPAAFWVGYLGLQILGVIR